MTRLAEVKAEREEQRAQRMLLESALQCAVTEKPQAVQTFRPEKNYTVKLAAYRLDGPCGGLVVKTEKIGDQKPTVSAILLDVLDQSWQLGIDRYAMLMREAIGRLKHTRAQLCSQQAG